MEKKPEQRVLKKFAKEQSTTVINEKTGEIMHSASVKEGFKEVEPPYVKMYVEDIALLNRLPKSASKVLTVLVANMSYGNIVVLIKPIKEEIVKQTGLSYSGVKKSIIDLTKSGLIIRRERSVYLIDPKLFGKGSWSNIKKLRMTIEYNHDGTKKVNSNIASQLKLNI